MVALSAWDTWCNSGVAEVDEAVIRMERTGFLVDADYCARQALVAREDERAALEDLYRWAQARGFQPLAEVRDTRQVERTRTLKSGEVRVTAVTERYLRDPTWEEQREATHRVWSSPVQLQRLLHSSPGTVTGALGLAPSPVWKKGRVRTERGEVKLDETALDFLATRYPEHREFLGRLIELRRIRGGIKYLTKLPTFIGPDGRVHPVYGPAGDLDDRVGAVTWRLAGKNPECQQFPKQKKKDRYRIRRAVVAGPGNLLIAVDYSALEVVVLAHLCLVLFQDPQIAEMVAPGGPDIHSVNARKIFGELLGWSVEFGPRTGQRVADLPLEAFKCDADESLEDPYGKYLRDLVKTVWYGLQYGKGDYGFGWALKDAAGNPIGPERAGVIRTGLLRAVPGIQAYMGWVLEFIRLHGGIPSVSGAWCDLAALVESGDQWQLARAHRRALNYPMQATVARIIGAAMVAITRDPVLAALGFRLVLQVHDELVLEGPEENAPGALARTMELMRGAYPLRVPLQVSGKSGRNYMECK